ncbi:MAG: nucleotidyltransferase substrate binding protein [Magnetococcales bacterium]|nr:nucleotidyltransferase substrate binding protein [Magnetococcales bacterium]
MDLGLDFSSFFRATERLAEGVDLLRERPDETIVRDGVIQRFEFTYELAHKSLRRYLEVTAASPNVLDEISFQDLIRTGYEQGLLLHSWDRWKEYRQCRTNTSHAHDEIKAGRVLETIPAFLAEVHFLLEQLQRRTERM